MNNENNNEFTQSSMNNQVSNFQQQPTLMPQQSVHPETNIQQQINNQQMMTQQFGGQAPNISQPINPQVLENNMSQPTMMKQSQMQQQPTMIQQPQVQPMMDQQFRGQVSNNQNSNNSKTKLILIIGGITLGIIILVIVLIFVIGNSNNKEKNNKYENINDYEENVTNGSSDNNNKDYISFKGFDFKKSNGYQYSVDSDGLKILNNTFATFVDISSVDYEQIKTQSNFLIQQYQNEGLILNNYKVDFYGKNKKEAMTFEITQDNQSSILYITSIDKNNIIVGMTMNSSYSIDYSNVNTAMDLINEIKFSGDYKALNEDNLVLEFKRLLN